MMIIQFLICLCVLLASSTFSLAENKDIAFDSDVYYDIYFSGHGENSFVMRRVKISENGSLAGEPYLVVKSDRALKDSAGRGYIFMRGIYSIVPSDYFRIDNASSISK